jgi:hypothetical protein
MKILDDQRFIEQDDGDPGFGLIKSADGFRSWAVLPLRLGPSTYRSTVERGRLLGDQAWFQGCQHCGSRDVPMEF